MSQPLSDIADSDQDTLNINVENSEKIYDEEELLEEKKSQGPNANAPEIV
jgi:hypothetical protein